MIDVTEGHLLGGRLRYAQPVDGYRTGIEPVLLAACVPARPGERVLEAGTGAGAGLLCLLARVPGLAAVGVELDPAMAALARRNLSDNRLAAEIIAADVLRGGWPPADHVFANPPWHQEGSTASPLPRRRLAKQERGPGMGGWVASLAGSATRTLTLIMPADRAAPVASLAAASCHLGRAIVQPLLPKPGRAAKLAILQLRCGAPSLDQLAPLILHEPDGCFTPAAARLLREGDPVACLAMLDA